jgi:hypothetical protein
LVFDILGIFDDLYKSFLSTCQAGQTHTRRAIVKVIINTLISATSAYAQHFKMIIRS